MLYTLKYASTIDCIKLYIFGEGRRIRVNGPDISPSWSEVSSGVWCRDNNDKN